MANESKTDTAVYRGLNLKIDLFSPIYTTVSTASQTGLYEFAVNVNLLDKYLPTIEFGYGHCTHTLETAEHYTGQGFYTRIGVDFNLMKSKEGTLNNLFFVGARAAMAIQDFSVNNVIIKDEYWGTDDLISYSDVSKFDAWVEVLGGVQVEIYKGFNMGWTIRYKTLITSSDTTNLHPWYIPGFGRNTSSLWAFNYYIGYTF